MDEFNINLNINYQFRNRGLLGLALTQSGIDYEHNNERLEFIGDRVLGLVVAELLYKKFPHENEGALARRHAMLVSTHVLAQVAKGLDIASRIRHGHMTGGRMQHMLADAMEAVLGAVFMDGGFNAAHDVVSELWGELILRDPVPPKDDKTKLQELVQKLGKGALPAYEYKTLSGEPHCPVFWSRVHAMGRSAEGTGASKKIASTMAATELLKILDNSAKDGLESTEQKE